MAPRIPQRLPPEPPPPIMEAFRKRFSGRDLQAFGALITLRATALQAENAVTEWLAGSAGSVARFQILGVLWASEGRGVPHKEIVEALGVTRATVSGLMAGLDRDGLVQSTVDPGDRRNLIATATPRGLAIVERAMEANASRLRAAFASLTKNELATLTGLLQRVREGFTGRGGK